MRKTILAVTAALALSAAGAASAGTANGNLAVTAQTTAACNLNPSTLDFGTFPGVVTAPINVTGTISATCSGIASVSYGTASTWPASMPNGLKYTVYSDAGRTKTWDNATNVITVSTQTANVWTGAVYGQIPAGQTSASTAAQSVNLAYVATFN